jgi:polar amino acid transport system ATP-binding protein
MITLRDVTKTYETAAGRFTALHRVDLDVRPGEFVAVVGRSGSGKSTLLNMVAGIDRPSAGTVAVGGASLSALSSDQLATWRGRTVGVVFQFFQLLPTLTVLENVLLPMDFCGVIPGSQRRARALELLRRVDVPEQADKLPAALSGGQQQRVAIARALAMEPPAMLFDEPTSALDPEMVGEVLSVMRDLVRDGMTMMCVTHEMNFARDVADRVWFMDAGRVLETAPPDEFFKSPQHPRAQRFLSELRTR